MYKEQTAVGVLPPYRSKQICKEESIMNVKVYTTPACPYCGMAKKYLEAKNVQYQEIDVSADRNAAAQMIRISGQRGVPVIDIDGSVVIGVDKEKIDSLIG